MAQNSARKAGKLPPARAIPLLPDPIYLGPRRAYTKGAARDYLAALAGETRGPAPDDMELISAKEFRRMLGNVSNMWLFRHSRRAAEEEVA